MFAEITRILNHLLNVTTYALDCGAITPALWGFEQREHLLEFYEAVGGSHYHVELLPPRRRREGPAGRAGGRDRRLVPRSSRTSSTTSRALLTENRIFKQRTVDIGVMTAEQAMDWGFSGPVPARLRLRLGPAQVAALRDVRPAGVRHPGRPHGDCYDRYLVRMQEMRQSLRIIEQCLAQMKPGPVKIADNKIAPPPRGEMKRSMEALIHHFKLYTEGYHVPAGATYTVTEAPKGEFGVYLVADGTNRPYRCKIRAPGFAHLQAMEALSKGHMLADAVAIIGSLDIVFGEIDR